MDDRIEKLTRLTEVFTAENLQEVEVFRIKMLGKNGEVTSLFEEFKTLEPQRKKEAGQKLNDLKNKLQNRLDFLKDSILAKNIVSTNERLDVSVPSQLMFSGSRHPVSLIRNEIISIFSKIGFVVAEGPEIEDDWHNFSALNFPPEHPARDMQDTVFISVNPDIVLRTHTSSVQVRTMENQKPPIRIVAPGRVYRNEAISARAHVFFHQVEGLFIDRGVSFADLKQTLLYFAREMFSSDTQIRLRPSYFPFTEPSAEMDISCNLCGGKGCGFCKKTGWVEILGCGMVDPNVLDNCGIDSKEFSGYAFGMGVERITNLKYMVKDLRMFSENDIRFLKQFEAEYR